MKLMYGLAWGWCKFSWYVFKVLQGSGVPLKTFNVSLQELSGLDVWQYINVSKPKDRVALSFYSEMKKVLWYSVDAWCWRSAESVTRSETLGSVVRRWGAVRGGEGLKGNPAGEQRAVSLRAGQAAPSAHRAASGIGLLLLRGCWRGSVCQVLRLSLSPWGFECPKFEKRSSTKKGKKSSKSYYPKSTIASFLVLFALLVFYPILYFLNKILYCVC